jgi:hypothetical protein
MRPVTPGRPGLAGRLHPPVTDEEFDLIDGPPPASGLLPPPDGPRGPFGRPGPTPPPSMGAGSARLGGPQDGLPRSSAPMPGGASFIPGFGNGLTDPEEPTEGIRLLH